MYKDSDFILAVIIGGYHCKALMLSPYENAYGEAHTTRYQPDSDRSIAII